MRFGHDPQMAQNIKTKDKSEFSEQSTPDEFWREKMRASQFIYHAALNPNGKNNAGYYVVNLYPRGDRKCCNLGVIRYAKELFKRYVFLTHRTWVNFGSFRHPQISYKSMTCSLLHVPCKIFPGYEEHPPKASSTQYVRENSGFPFLSW